MIADVYQGGSVPERVSIVTFADNVILWIADYVDLGGLRTIQCCVGSQAPFRCPYLVASYTCNKYPDDSKTTLLSPCVSCLKDHSDDLLLLEL